MESNDMIGKIIDFECGMMSDDEAIVFFQELIDTGMIGSLQGTYQRTAARLVNMGLCHW